jgi:hypothetical protein
VKSGAQPNEFELIGPREGAEFAERVVATVERKAAQSAKKAEGAALGGPVSCAQPG